MMHLKMVHCKRCILNGTFQNVAFIVIARKYGDMCEVLEPQDNLEEYLMTKELLNGIFGTVPSLISSFWWASRKNSGIRILQSPKSRCSDCSADSVRPVLKFSIFFFRPACSKRTVRTVIPTVVRIVLVVWTLRTVRSCLRCSVVPDRYCPWIRFHK